MRFPGQGVYKVNNQVEVRYLSKGNETGLTDLSFTVTNPSGLDSAPANMTEIAPGLYRSFFTPNALGYWLVRVSSTSKPQNIQSSSYFVYSDWSFISALITSVNGKFGVVTLTTTDLPEGSNLYYTNARVDSEFDARLATKSTTNLAEGANLYYTVARDNAAFDARIATKSTSDLAEGSRLYYTNARVDAEFDIRLATKTTTNLVEGTNLYYTDARFDARLAAKTTTNIVEGTNLYYTQARFDSAFAAKNTGNLTEGANLYYTTARFDARFAAKSTTDLPEGANLYYTDARVDARIALNSTQSVLKTVDESVTSSATLHNDATLKLTLLANTNYIINGYISVLCTSATPDFKLAMVIPSGIINLSYAGMATTAVHGSGVLVASGASVGAITIPASLQVLVHIKGTVRVGATGGVMNLQWAQNTSTAVATTVQAGAFLKAEKI